MKTICKLTFLTFFCLNSYSLEKVYFILEDEKEFVDVSTRDNIHLFTKVEKGQTFSQIVYEHIGNYYSLNVEELLHAYSDANPNIKDFDSIMVGQVIKHPLFLTGEEFLKLVSDDSWKIRSIANSKESQKENNVSEDKTTIIKRSFSIGLGYGLSSNESFDKRNSSRSKLISAGEINYSFRLGLNINDDHEIGIGFSNRTYQFEAPAGSSFEGESKKTLYLESDYIFSLSSNLKIGALLNYGTDMFQISSNGNIQQESIQSLVIGPKVSYKIFEHNKLNIGASFSYGLRKSSASNLDMESGYEYQGRFHLEMPISAKITIGSEIFYLYRFDESSNYEQSLKNNGVIFNLKFGF